MTDANGIDLPWHAGQWQLVHKQLQSGRRPHAMLLTGPVDLGKREFARSLAARLLCKDPDLRAGPSQCGRCVSCNLLSAGTHPDLRLIHPEESKLIRVDQIRAANDWVVQTPSQGGDKVVIIYPAEQMNAQASNALLKCLEEPTPRTLFLLVSDQPSRLLPTIRSRCQKLRFQVPETGSAIEYLRAHSDGATDLTQMLALAGGSPLKVLRSIDAEYLKSRSDAVGVVSRVLSGEEASLDGAGSLRNQDPLRMVRVLQSLTSDAIKSLMGVDEGKLTNRDLLQVVEQLGASIGIGGLFSLCDKIHLTVHELDSNSNPNSQLLLESLLIECAALRH